MNIKHHLKKGYTGESHSYSLIILLTEEDIESEKIKEFVLKIRVQDYLGWQISSEFDSVTSQKKGLLRTFQVRKEGNLYSEDMPLQIFGPDGELGEILYELNYNVFDHYEKESLSWELYGDGVKSQSGKVSLSELNEF